jgi:hypothetical protein
MILDSLAQFLSDNGLCTYSSVGGDTFLAVLPASPDECVAVFPGGVGVSDYGLDEDTITLTIRVRGSEEDPVGPADRATAVYRLLRSYCGTWGDLRVIWCRATRPSSAGADRRGRHTWTVQVTVTVRADA